MTIIDKIIKKVEDDKRLEQDTRNDISEKLKNISSIDGYLGQIDIYWEIEQPQDTTVFGPFNPTPLLLAIELSYIDIAIELIEKHNNSGYMKTDNLFSIKPLQIACMRDEKLFDMILSKVEKQVNIVEYLNDNTNFMGKILSHAIKGGIDSIVLKLYKKGARLDQLPKRSILSTIINNDIRNEDEKLALIKKFIENGETFRDNKRVLYTTTLDEICGKGLFKIAFFLVEEHGYNPETGFDSFKKMKELKELFIKKWKSSKLEAAVVDNDINSVKETLKPLINEILHAINNAYLLNNEEIIDYFEEHPELYHLITESNKNIWHIASSSGNLRLIKQLQVLVKKDNDKNTIFNSLNKSKKSIKRGGNKSKRSKTSIK